MRRRTADFLQGEPPVSPDYYSKLTVSQFSAEPGQTAKKRSARQQAGGPSRRGAKRPPACIDERRMMIACANTTRILMTTCCSSPIHDKKCLAKLTIMSLTTSYRQNPISLSTAETSTNQPSLRTRSIQHPETTQATSNNTTAAPYTVHSPPAFPPPAPAPPRD